MGMVCNRCLSSGGQNKIPQNGGLNNRNLFSHSSGGWKVQGQDVGHFGFWGGLPSWFTGGCLLPVSLHEQKINSHPLSSPSPPAPNPSQHQRLFQSVNSSHEVAKVLEFQLQHHSVQRTPRTDLRQNGLVGSPCSPRDSQESSPTPQFKSINSSALSFLYSPTLTSIHDYCKNHSPDQMDLC